MKGKWGKTCPQNFKRIPYLEAAKAAKVAII